MILTSIYAIRTPHTLHIPARPSSNQSIPLQTLIILDMLRKLTQRIPSSRALRATQERHLEKSPKQNSIL